MRIIAQVRLSKRCLQAVSSIAASALLLACATATAQSAQTSPFIVLYSFHGATGEYPLAALIVDPEGNLYGTTQNGGAHGFGTVFEITNAGNEIVLHSFSREPDGRFPLSSLVLDMAGNLYGTTTRGGSSGYGTVFKVEEATGKETVLYSFKGIKGDGSYPSAGLVLDSAGNLYGTTQEGGEADFGTIFKLDTAGTETVLHSFAGYPKDGEYPIANLIWDNKGSLYGTTEIGGRFNSGTIFKLDASGNESLIFSGTGGKGGGYPFGGVIRDNEGNFYSTAAYGGDGVGTVFEVNPKGVETVLYTFTGSDGSYPSAGLVRDAMGNLYGTTEFGGTIGPGAIFEITKPRTEIVLHSFDGSDGADILTGLVIDNSGNLYGTATEGGAFNKGTVFKLVR
jgi:uncharacterized repeat protein (TIGR03803 family)